MEGLHICVVLLRCAQIHKAEDVGIHSATTDLISSRLREICLAETGQKRTDNHNRTTELRTFSDEILAHDVISIDLISLECIYTFVVTGHLHAHAFQQKDQILDVQNLRNIRYLHLFLGKKNCTDDLQGLIFGTLWSDCTAELMPAFNYE